MLFGMMAVGKTTVARRLGARLGRAVLDTDELVAARAGAPIRTIFAELGEAGFRELEREAVREVSERDDAIVAVGGGAVLDETNVEILRRNGVLVHLAAPAEVINARLATSTAVGSRPLLAGGDVRETVDRLLLARVPHYRTVADHEVDATGRAAEVVQRVLEVAARRGDVLSEAEFAATGIGEGGRR